MNYSLVFSLLLIRVSLLIVMSIGLLFPIVTLGYDFKNPLAQFDDFQSNRSLKAIMSFFPETAIVNINRAKTCIAIIGLVREYADTVVLRCSTKGSNTLEGCEYDMENIHIGLHNYCIQISKEYEARVQKWNSDQVANQTLSSGLEGDNFSQALLLGLLGGSIESTKTTPYCISTRTKRNVLYKFRSNYKFDTFQITTCNFQEECERNRYLRKYLNYNIRDNCTKNP